MAPDLRGTSSAPTGIILMTIRSHDQFNTTIYGLHDRYRGVHGGRRVLFMNPADAEARGWKAGNRVDITSHFGERAANGAALPARPLRHSARGAWPRTYPEANVLVPIGSVAEESNTPTYKSIHVTLEPSREAEAGP